MSWIDSATVLKPAPKVIWEEVNGELVIYKLSSGNYFRLNTSGAVIWKFILENLSCAEIAKNMRDRFKQKSADVDKETDEFLDSLVNEELVQIAA